jgi:hypothetical protein
MKRPFITFATVIGLGAAVCLGYMLGLRNGRFQVALQENKIGVTNLKLQGTNLSPQLREYLKTRIYSNIEAFYPSRGGYLIRGDWDFGPVDRGALGAIATFKEDSTFDWDAAVKRK